MNITQENGLPEVAAHCDQGHKTSLSWASRYGASCKQPTLANGIQGLKIRITQYVRRGYEDILGADSCYEINT
jgi:hypothetical protein